MEPAGDPVQPILRVSDVSVALDGRPVLERVSFALAPGDTLVILGPNGGGKTVLLRTLLGTLPHTGEISWAPGVRMGYVPQKLSAERQLPLTGLDLLQVKARVSKLPPAAIADAVRATELSQQVLETPFGKLSGGQAQRVLIASGLLGDPPVLMLDEPFNGLDPEGIVWIRSFLRSLATQGRAVLVSSHLMSELQDTAGHLVIVGRGRVIADTSVADLIASASGDRVTVRTTARWDAMNALTNAGGTVAATSGDTITVAGLPAGRVVAVLGANQVAFSEVSAHRATLEEAYMELTRDAVEFRAAAASEAVQ